MCIAPKMPSPPRPPAPVMLPSAPAIANISAEPQRQGGPAKGSPDMPAGMDAATIKRRGKRGMTIQFGGSAGTNIPGA